MSNPWHYSCSVIHKLTFCSNVIKIFHERLYLYLFFSENGDIPVKTAALKKVIQLILNGERLPAILMTVIRFVMPLEDHTIKKLLLVFWEIVPKTTSDGKLLQQMILVCDAYRKVSFGISGSGSGSGSGDAMHNAPIQVHNT